MIRKRIFIFIILTVVACQNNKTENHLTKLEEFFIKTNSSIGNSKAFEQITNKIITKRLELKQDAVRSTKEDANGLLNDQSFRFYCDTTENQNEFYYLIRIKEFNSERQAAEAFEKIIEFHACCVPDEDIAKLKNFENLRSFKNGASTTLLTENLIIEILNKREAKQEVSNLLDEILNGRKYLKLEIGNGGPAIWTRK